MSDDALMESPEFEPPAPGPRDRIYVSWDEHWHVEKYIVHYLRSRELPTDEETRTAALACIETYSGRGAYRKAETDIFLDRAFASGFVPPKA